METGVPQGSPVSPILFVLYLSGVFIEIEQTVDGAECISFADDVGVIVTRTDFANIAIKLSAAGNKACAWAAENGISFDVAKMEAVAFHKRRKALDVRIHVR